MSVAHNTQGLWKWEQRIVDEFLSPGSRVAVLAAGGGREAVALAQAGFKVQGFECNPALVGVARDVIRVTQARTSVEFLAADESPVGTWDAVWFGWAGYMHVIGQDRRIDLLRSLRQIVPLDGLLVLVLHATERSWRARAVTGGAYAFGRFAAAAPSKPGMSSPRFMSIVSHSRRSEEKSSRPDSPWSDRPRCHTVTRSLGRYISDVSSGALHRVA